MHKSFENLSVEYNCNGIRLKIQQVFIKQFHEKLI